MATLEPYTLRPADAAQYLGISEITLWRYNKRGLLPLVHLTTGPKGGARAFRRTDLERFADERIDVMDGGHHVERSC